MNGEELKRFLKSIVMSAGEWYSRGGRPDIELEDQSVVWDVCHDIEGIGRD